MAKRWENLVYTGHSFNSEEGSHCMEWDEKGIYKGQWQGNVMDDSGGEIFIKARSVHDETWNLTNEEMEIAKEYKVH